MGNKQTRFARAFEPWIEVWSEIGVTAREMQVLLMLIVSMERQAGGDFIASRPRADIAQALGISDNAVRCAIKSLRSKKILKPIGSSHPGWTQRYVVMPMDGAGKNVRITVPNNGGSSKTHQNNNGGSTSTKMGGPTPPIWGVESDPPTRSEEGACAAPSYEGRPSAGEIGYGAKSAENARMIV